jgi:hypothetical protein
MFRRLCCLNSFSILLAHFSEDWCYLRYIGTNFVCSQVIVRMRGMTKLYASFVRFVFPSSPTPMSTHDSGIATSVWMLLPSTRSLSAGQLIYGSPQARSSGNGKGWPGPGYVTDIAVAMCIQRCSVKCKVRKAGARVLEGFEAQHCHFRVPVRRMPILDDDHIESHV